jgi:integrase
MMGRTLQRVGKGGDRKFTAYFRDENGVERSAGTFTVRREAERAWRRREHDVAAGERRRQEVARQSLARYARESWFPAHVCEAATRQSYAFWLERYVLPLFGEVRLERIDTPLVQRTLTALARDGASRDIVEAVRCVLGAIFTTAVQHGIVRAHPCQHVKLPREVRAPLKVLTPEEFELALSLMSDPVARLMVETAVESGARWGELAELRSADLDTATGTLTISRAVVELQPRFHPTGGRFLVKPYPKGGRHRRLRLRPVLTEKLLEHITRRGLGPDDLLFATREYYAQRAPARGPREPADHGDDAGPEFTAPNRDGRQYRHGTQAGYGPGGCRCPRCRQAIATYRARRRAQGLDRPPQVRRRVIDGHLSRAWFRKQRWRPALAQAGIERKVTFHDLRHAHASWLLEGGASLAVVSERLGHASIVSTARYLHTLPIADDEALAALDTIRPPTSTPRVAAGLSQRTARTRLASPARQRARSNPALARVAGQRTAGRRPT